MRKLPGLLAEAKIMTETEAPAQQMNMFED
jgi:hypothetical protein